MANGIEIKRFADLRELKVVPAEAEMLVHTGDDVKKTTVGAVIEVFAGAADEAATAANDAAEKAESAAVAADKAAEAANSAAEACRDIASGILHLKDQVTGQVYTMGVRDGRMYFQWEGDTDSEPESPPEPEE